MTETQAERDWMTTAEASRALEVSEPTARNWFRTHQLGAVVMNRRRFDRAAVERLARGEYVAPRPKPRARRKAA